MKRLVWTGWMALFVLAGPLTAAAQVLERDVYLLTWLAGCWQLDGKPAGSGEMWTAPDGGLLLGVSKTLRTNGRPPAWEQMRIESDKNGVYFVARPSGQAEARFKASLIDSARAVFDNPDHDFPQRITYERRNGRLYGRIGGQDNGQTKAFEYPMSRVSCPG